MHRVGRTGRGKQGVGHALVFFEYYAKMPSAGGHCAVLRGGGTQHKFGKAQFLCCTDVIHAVTRIPMHANLFRRFTALQTQNVT